jgi:hypothetical protein
VKVKGLYEIKLKDILILKINVIQVFDIATMSVKIAMARKNWTAILA